MHSPFPPPAPPQNAAEAPQTAGAQVSAACVIGLLTTGGTAFWIFGRMWVGFVSVSRSEALGYTSGACLLSGLLAAALLRTREIPSAYHILSGVPPLGLGLLLLMGCLETVVKQQSLDSLQANWLLLLMPPALFLAQTAPVAALQWVRGRRRRRP